MDDTAIALKKSLEMQYAALALKKAENIRDLNNNLRHRYYEPDTFHEEATSVVERYIDQKCQIERWEKELELLYSQLFEDNISRHV